MSDINLKAKTHRAKVLGNIWKSRGVGEERNEATRTSNRIIRTAPDGVRDSAREMDISSSIQGETSNYVWSCNTRKFTEGHSS
jgi:hypothetical protein